MEDNIQLMENYLQGNLNKEGLEKFDKKLKEESSFESDFRNLKAIQVGVKASAQLTILDQLERLESSIAEKEISKTNYTMKKLVTVAASLILIATVSYFTAFNTNNVTSGPDIYNEFYSTYRNMESTTERGDASALVSLKDKAYFAYDSKDFVQSAALFSEVLKTEKTAANYFYAGISSLEIGDHPSATKNLNTVTNNYEDLAEQSQWYLALNLLKENSETSNEEALSSLVDLALGESSYKSNAEAVLAKMNISLANDNGGVVIVIYQRPREETSPDGSEVDARGFRSFQWGVVESNGKKYRFFNDNPINGLGSGDAVRVIVLREPNGRSQNSKGFAFIL